MHKALLALIFMLASAAPAAAGPHAGMGGGHFGGGPIFIPQTGGMGGHMPGFRGEFRGFRGEFHDHHLGFHHHFFGTPFFDEGDDFNDYSPVSDCRWQHWRGHWRKICMPD
jgi:hypothetical protein